MQLRHVLTTALLALCCADGVAGRQILQRQDSTQTTAVTSTTNTDSSNSSPSSTPTSDGGSQASSPNHGSSTTTATAASTKTGGAGTFATSTLASKTSGTSTPRPTRPSDPQLPIKPSITPALGVAGVILIVTGIAYTLIGIKHQWMLTFLSAAYLTSLAVTVLIIYVMNPPISDAIQGAYFVAAFFTGIIFGGIALVFKEVTEGLGCLLGGFCLAMWFLVLSPGGLIKSSSGRGIMIGVFCAVGWSLSFSQYTRNYGLILCTAFAGAQLTIIGIDCFSRAGLKEFWLYLWDLNHNEFPIHTTTYPITRGIRVEIAGTIVLFLFGVMSQVKVWKIVKERRAKKEEKQRMEDESREQRDSAIGKTVEADNERSLADWERIYGDKQGVQYHSDSGVGTSVDSLAKKSTSVRERELESIEMDDNPGTAKQKRGSKGIGPSVLVRVASEDEVPDERSEQRDMSFDNNDELGWWADNKSTKSFRGKSNRTSPASIDQSSLNEMPVQPGGPEVVPLPFSPPVIQEEDEPEAASENDSVGTKMFAEKSSVHERRGVSLNKLALEKLDGQASTGLPRIDDDRASSVAATDNDEHDAGGALLGNRSSLAPSPYQIDFKNKESLSPFSDNFKDRTGERSRNSSAPGTPGEAPVVELDEEELVRPSTDKGAEAKAQMAKQKSTKPPPKISAPDRRSTSSKVADDADGEHFDGEDSETRELNGNLPESMSKVAMAYRTNEWAKHIADADEPDLEEAPGQEEPGVKVNIGLPEEEPRRVDTSALLETGASIDPSQGVMRKASKQSTNPYQRSSKDVGPSLSRRSSGAPIYAFQRTNSQQSLQRQNSSTSVVQQKRVDTRSSSAPLAQWPLIESPSEEALANSGPYGNSVTPGASSTNLLDERNDRLKRRTTTTSFAALREAAENANPDKQEPDNISLTDRNHQPINEEDLTLAERKALIQQGTIQPTTSPQQTQKQPRRSSNPPPAPAPAPGPSRMNSTTNNKNIIYDSHQPKRSNTVDTARQSAMLTQWRSSLTPHQVSRRESQAAEEQARQAMMMQRQQSEHRKQRRESQMKKRESMIDVAMRTGQLTSAHQDALRRMQNQVKTKE